MKKLLLIEDDQIVANIYRNKFTIEGFQVEIALDGQVGFDLVRSFKPDVILLDLLLPKMTGVELMKKIRAEPEFETLPIIVFSNTYLTNLVQDAWKAGATKCISKSHCTPKQVIDIIKGTLSANGAVTSGALAPPAPSHSPPPAQRTDNKAISKQSEDDAEFQPQLPKSFLDSLPSTPN